MYKSRIDKIFKLLDNKIDAIIIKNNSDPYMDSNFFNFTGLEEGLFENCCAILFRNKKSELIISNLEYESAKKSKSEFNINTFYDKKSYNECIIELLKSCKYVGLNYNDILYKDYIYFSKLFPRIQFNNISKNLNILRLIKDIIDIEKIRKACKIVDKIILEIPIMVYDGITENELVAEIDYLIQKNGAKKPAFDSICSFGGIPFSLICL